MERLFRNIRVLNEGIRVVDIGANVGEFTSTIVRKYPHSVSHMFEANPKCENYLMNIGQPYHMIGLGSEVGSGELYIETINPYATGASFYKETTEWYGEGKYDIIKVPIQTLDSFELFEGDSIHLVKIDTQGSEYSIIQGGRETLNRTELLLVEVSLMEYNQSSPQMEEVINLVEQLGFRVKDIVETHRYNNRISQMDILFSNEKLK